MVITSEWLTSKSGYEQRRGQMVLDQIIARGVRDERVLAAIHKIIREDFVPPHLQLATNQDAVLMSELRRKPLERAIGVIHRSVHWQQRPWRACQTPILSESRKMINIARTPPPEKPDTPICDETAHTDPGPDPVSDLSPDPVSDTFADSESVSDRSLVTSQGDRDWNDAQDRYAMIAEASYYKAEQRGFELGYEQLDWLEAEQELLEQLGQEEIY